MTDSKMQPEDEKFSRTSPADSGRSGKAELPGAAPAGRALRGRAAYHREGEGGRRSFPGRASGDAVRDEKNRDSGEQQRRDRSAEHGDQRLRGAAGALIELDRDLMKLLVRRSVLVSRIRGGRDYAASPEAVMAEKDVRMAWENGALAFSKDPRFTRQLFTLLQDLKVLSKEQAEQTGIFTLVPSAKPLSGELTGPVDTRMAQMYTALAACRGEALSLEALSLSEALIDTVKACSQAGADVSRHGQGAGPGGVAVARAAPLSFTGKTIYVGEDFFTLYLMAFLAVGRPGACRLAGGARLKGADLSVLRQTLPLFGARLAPVVPHSQGLPVSLESSGAIPPQVLIPADLPLEAVCALLLAPLVWNTPVILNLAALPASVAAAALAEVGAVHLACGADVESQGAQLSFSPGALQAYERPSLSLDSSLCAYLLALPAFAGGSLSLKGSWPAHLPGSLEVESLLSWAGLAVRILGTSITVEAARPPFSVPLQCNELSPQLGPLFLALAARRCMLGADTPSLRKPAPFPSDDAQKALTQEFYERIGLLYADGCLTSSDTDGRVSLPAHTGAAKTGHSAWTSPDAYWSMAFALAAFLRPGLRLANPGSVTEVMPAFWSIYNSLPHPADPVRRTQEAVQESKNDKPARRRVIAD